MVYTNVFTNEAGVASLRLRHTRQCLAGGVRSVIAHGPRIPVGTGSLHAWAALLSHCCPSITINKAPFTLQGFRLR